MILDLPRNSTLYKIPGTKTFRASSTAILSRKPQFKGWGCNMQNIEESARKMYWADGVDLNDNALIEKLLYYLETGNITVFTDEQRAKIKILVQPDQAGAEALVVAYLCPAGNFRELFLNNVKPHVFVALHVFKHIWQQKMQPMCLDIKFDVAPFIAAPIKQLKTIPFWKELDKLIKDSDKWVAKERYYFVAKQMCHSLNYDAQAGMFRLNTLEKSGGKIVISKEEAMTYVDYYHSLFPEIREWHRTVQRQLEETKTLYLLQGYPIEFTSESCCEPTELKEAYARVPQGTVGCITHIAFTNLQELIEDTHLQWDLLANTHDSYVAQCPIGEEKECGKIMTNFMQQDLISPRGEPFKMRAEVNYGFNWSKQKKQVNELGLRELIIN